MRLFIATSCQIVGLLFYAELAALNVAQQSQVASQTASLSGTVVALTGEAIPAAKVSVFRGAETTAQAQASSDNRGAFLFEHLPPGRYSVVGEKPGFLKGRLGVSTPGQIALQVALDPGDAAHNLIIRLSRGGSVSGRVIDQRGDARGNVQVLLITTGPAALRRSDDPSPIRTTTTDELGRYQLSALTPGRYFVVAMPPQIGVPMSIGRTDAGQSVYLPVYYPGASLVRQALPISVVEATDVSQIDIQFSPQPVATVEGTVTGLTGQPSQIKVSLVESAVPSFLPTRTVDIDREGRFNFSGVAPGEYTVVARSTFDGGGVNPIAADTTLWGKTDLTIQSGGRERIALSLEPLADIVGKAMPEQADPALPKVFSAILEPAGRKLPGVATQRVTVDAESGFAFADVVPGSYRLSFAGGDLIFPARTIRVDAETRNDGLIEHRSGGQPTRVAVQVGNAKTGLTGSLNYRDGRPAQDHYVVLFPSSSALWLPLPRRIQVVRPDSKGRFTIAGMDPGEYKVVAITDIEPGSEYDRETLATWTASGLVVLLELGKITRLDLAVPERLGVAGTPTATIAPQARSTAETSIRDAIAASGAEVAVVWQPLDGQPSERLAVNARERFHAASTMKVPIMIELFRRAAAGDLRLDDTMLVTNRFASIVDGSPYDLSVTQDSDGEVYTAIGQQRSYRVLCEAMITVSSNLAANLLIERLGAKQIQATVDNLGAGGMQVLRGVEDQKAFDRGLNNTTDAEGLAMLFLKLGRGEVVSPAASREMIDILARQKFNEGIPAGVAAGVRVAHKTGWITRIRHDAGIVFAPRPYVLVVLVRGLDDAKIADALIARISAIVAGLGAVTRPIIAE